MKKIEGAIDVSEWAIKATTDFSEKVESVLKKAVAEALEIAFTSDDTFVQIDALNTRKPLRSDYDRTLLRLNIDLGGDPDNTPAWPISISDIVDTEISNISDDDDAARMAKFRDALREQADKIDAALSAAAWKD